MISLYLDTVNQIKATKVTPLNSSIPLTWKREEDEIMGRVYMDETLIFVKDDYDYIWATWSSAPCAEITLRIYDDCTGTDLLVFTGYCTWYDFIIDEDKCTIEAKFSPYDESRCLKENGDTEINIIECTDGVSVEAETVQTRIEYIWTNGRRKDDIERCPVKINPATGNPDDAIARGDLYSFPNINVKWGNSAECTSAGCDGLNCVIEEPNFLKGTNGEPSILGLYAFCHLDADVYQPEIAINTSDWRHVKSIYSYYLHYTARYMNIKSIFAREVYFTQDVNSEKDCSGNYINPTQTPPPGEGWVPMPFVSTGNKISDMELEFGLQNNVTGATMPRYPAEFEARYTTKAGWRKWTRPMNYGYDFTFTRSGCVNISYDATPSFPLTKNIIYRNGRRFSDVVNKLAWDTCGKYSSSRFFFDPINPLTGENPNPFLSMVFFQKSDVKLPSATNHATKGLMTFNQFATWMRNMFQVYWFVQDGRVWWEHISYFYGWIAGYESITAQTLDLTTFESGKWDRKKYSYSQTERPDREKFLMMEAGGKDFVGVDIIYDQLCSSARVKTNPITYTVEKITTDVNYIQNNPTLISNDGFVLMLSNGVKVGDQYYENGLLSGEQFANVYLSWANIHHRFWRYNRPLIDGNMNGFDTQFYTRGIVEGEQLQFFLCCQYLNITDKVKTSIGIGDISEINLELLTKKCLLNLKYGRSV